jgi:hypothetical protein
MIIKVESLINNLWVDTIVSYKYYTECVCGFKFHGEDNTNIYQSGYFYNPNKGWIHISNLGNPDYIKKEIRSKRLNFILNI